MSQRLESILYIVVAIALACIPLRVDAKDLVTLEYTADTLPENASPSWYRRTLGTVQLAEINPPGVLHLVLVGDPNYNMNDQWSLAGPIPSGHDVVFMEIRIRMESTPSQDYVLSLFYNQISTRIRMNNNAVGYFATLGPSWNHAMDTTDGFHTYRLESDRAAESHRFYIDGELVHVTDGIHESFVGSSIRIGNFGPDWTAEMYIDSIRAGVVSAEVSTERTSWASIKALYPPQTQDINPLR